MSDLRLNGNGGDLDPMPDPNAEPRTRDMEIDPPIELNGKTYTTLHLEEPTAKMVELAENELGFMSPTGQVSLHALRKYQIMLVSQGSKVPRPVIERMRISQVQDAADFLATFIGSGRATGET